MKKIKGYQCVGATGAQGECSEKQVSLKKKCNYCSNPAIVNKMGENVCSDHLKKVNSQIDRAFKSMGFKNHKEK